MQDKMRFYNSRNYFGGEERRRPKFRSKRGRWRLQKMVCAWTLVKTALALSIVTLILQIVGFTCPGWITMTIDLSVLPGSTLLGVGKMTTYAAVWYVRVCHKLGPVESCTSSSHHDANFMGLQLSNALSDLANINWLEIEIETSLGLFLCLVGIVLTVICLCEPCANVSPKLWSVVAAGPMFASAIVLMPTVIKFSESIDDTNSAIAVATQLIGRDFITFHSPWAMVMTACGMVMAFICCIVLLIAACKHNELTSGIIRPNNSLQPYGYPLVIPAIFSNYHSMPMSDTMGQPHDRLPYSNGRPADIPITYTNNPGSDLSGFGPGPYVIYSPSMIQPHRQAHPPDHGLRQVQPPAYDENPPSKMSNP